MRFRAPVPDDAPAVLAVLAARDLADLGVVDYTLEDLQDEWRGSDLDLERDAQVVEDDDGRIIAYAAVRRPGTLAVVAPDREGRGVGSRLLEWAERRERERGRDVHRQWVAAANARARVLLTGAGYRCVRTYWRMVRALDDLGPAPAPPVGYRLRPVDAARDAPALHEVDAASFATAPDYVPESLVEFSEEHLDAHDFDPGLSRVAAREEEVAGFLLARRWRHESVGYVDILAVHPAHQGRGLGTTLLRSAFAAFAADGLREAQLGVDSANARGLGVYERAGMTVLHRTDIYERPVGGRGGEGGSSPSRWRSYRDVDAAADPGSLADQLDEIASVGFVAAEKQRSLELLELAPGASVLDVGCGTGPELEPLGRIVGPRGRVVGLERSRALIEAARGRGLERAGPIELVWGDAAALPFAAGEFHACRADRTLQHVEDPDAAIREMVRVLRPGGRLVVTESRWGLVAPSLDQELTDRVLGLLASDIEQADWLGDRLPAAFEQASLIGVRSVSADYTASEREELYRFTNLRSSVVEATRAGSLAKVEGGGWLSELDELIERGEAFAMVLILHVSGTKPPG